MHACTVRPSKRVTGSRMRSRSPKQDVCTPHTLNQHACIHTCTIDPVGGNRICIKHTKQGACTCHTLNQYKACTWRPSSLCLSKHELDSFSRKYLAMESTTSNNKVSGLFLFKKLTNNTLKWKAPTIKVYATREIQDPLPFWALNGNSSHFTS